jgi:hypothetical protein
MINMFMKKKKNKPRETKYLYNPEDKLICIYFHNHLKQGNSARTFITRLMGGEKSYAWLKDSNETFYELAEAFTPKQYRRGHRHYKPGKEKFEKLNKENSKV